MLRSRSTMPVRRSVASPTAVVMPAKATGLHEDARHQVVDVAQPGRVDRAAEDVAEHQHEHHRLDQHEDRLPAAPAAR
jgi:hypothetical protein